MKLFAVALVATVVASPAFAEEFKGPWVEARLGFDRVETVIGGRSGFQYGGGLGYDFNLGSKVVLGAQAGISGATTEFCVAGGCIGAGRDIEVLARLGAKVTERSLIYALGGYANGRVVASATGIGSVGVDVDGYRLGAGFEMAYNRHLFSKIEYRYTGYDFSVDRHQVSISLGYRF